MFDTQLIDIGIIYGAGLRKIGTKVGTVSTYDKSQLLQREVVLQIEASHDSQQGNTAVEHQESYVVKTLLSVHILQN